jgi:hypothetical protein
METGEQKSELIYTLKRSIQIAAKGEPTPVEINELILLEPNKYNLDAFYDFQSMGLGLLRKEMEKRKDAGEIPESTAPTADVVEPDTHEMANMIRLLVISTPDVIRPSEFITAFKKVIFCKGVTYVRAMDTKIQSAFLDNLHRDDWIKMACEYFAFFGIEGFTD